MKDQTGLTKFPKTNTSKLLWIICLRPLLRKPIFTLVMLFAIAMGTALFYSMLQANNKAVTSLKNPTLLLPGIELPPTTAWASHREITDEALEACTLEVLRGLSCAGVARSFVRQKDGSRLHIIGVEGNLPLGSQVFASADFNAGATLNAPGFATPVVISEIQEQLPRNTIVLTLHGLRTLLNRRIPLEEIHTWTQGSARENLAEVWAKAYALSPQSGDEAVELTASYRFNLKILALVSWLVCALFLWCMAGFQLEQKNQRYACLRGLGVSKGTSAKILAVEQLILAFLGAGIGLLLGAWFENLLSREVLATLNSIYQKSVPLEFSWNPQLALLSLFFGVGVYLAAVAVHVRSSLNQVPTRLRSQRQEKRWSPLVEAATIAISAILFLAAYLLPATSLESLLGSSRPQPIYGYLSAICIFALALVLSDRCSRMVAGALERISPPFAKIMTRKYLSGPPRHTSLMATLSCCLIFALGVSVMISSFRSSLTTWFDQLFYAEYVVYPTQKQQRITSFLKELEAHSDVDGYDCEIQSQRLWNDKTIQVHGVSYSQHLPNTLPIAFQQNPRQLAAPQKNQVFVSETFAHRNQVQIGDQLDIQVGDQLVALQVVASVTDYSSEAGYVLVDRPWLQQRTGEAGCSSMRVYGTLPPKDLNEFEDRFQVSIQPVKQLRSAVMERFEETFSVTWVLSLLTMVLGAMAIVLKVAQETVMEQQQWMTLRRSGCSWRQLLRLSFLDYGIALATAFVTSTVGGILLGWLLVDIIQKKSFGWQLGAPDSREALLLFGQQSVLILALVTIAAVVCTITIRPSEKWKGTQE